MLIKILGIIQTIFCEESDHKSFVNDKVYYH